MSVHSCFAQQPPRFGIWRSSDSCYPFWPVSNERNCEDDQLSRTGDNGNIGRFAASDELLVFDFEVMIEPRGDKRWQKRLPDVTPPPDMKTIPVHLPYWRVVGAVPDRPAACCAPRVPETDRRVAN